MMKKDGVWRFSALLICDKFTGLRCLFGWKIPGLKWNLASQFNALDFAYPSKQIPKALKKLLNAPTRAASHYSFQKRPMIVLAQSSVIVAWLHMTRLLLVLNNTRQNRDRAIEGTIV